MIPHRCTCERGARDPAKQILDLWIVDTAVLHCVCARAPAYTRVRGCASVCVCVCVFAFVCVYARVCVHDRAPYAKDFEKHVRGPVDHLSMRLEVGHTVDDAGHLDDLQCVYRCVLRVCACACECERVYVRCESDHISHERRKKCVRIAMR